MKPYTFRITQDLRDGLDAVMERDGIQPGEQIRRAIRRWLEEKGVLTGEEKRADRKQAATRKRS